MMGSRPQCAPAPGLFTSLIQQVRDGPACRSGLLGSLCGTYETDDAGAPVLATTGAPLERNRTAPSVVAIASCAACSALRGCAAPTSSPQGSHSFLRRRHVGAIQRRLRASAHAGAPRAGGGAEGAPAQI